VAQRPHGLELEILRVLPAAQPVVFEALTDPAELTKWWGPKGFSVAWLDFAPRVGAVYRIEMQPPEGEPFFLRGNFHEVNPPQRLSYSFAWENPDPDDVETYVQLSLRDLGEATEIGLSQGRFKSQPRWQLHHDGWTESFDKLEQLLSLRS
jgi:uncharacterized protein YndB with AHSA1/START domain